MNPLIFDIKRASTNDGPGVRTVIFFKGCNLNCFWCHNPEGKKPGKQMAFFEEKCVSCGMCKKVCLHPTACTLCGVCIQCCPSQARKCYGAEYTCEELLEIIRLDKDYYAATGGGVTFSGGECMLYPDFLAGLARCCKENGISVAIDTAGSVPFSSFEKVMPYTDLFLYDIKCLDSQLHKQGTGVGNETILENLQRLQTEKKRILIRIPEIPRFNQGLEVERVKTYCTERELPFEILPYHDMGESKMLALDYYAKHFAAQA